MYRKGSKKRKGQPAESQAQDNQKKRVGCHRSESDMEESSSEPDGHESGDNDASSTLNNSVSAISGSTGKSFVKLAVTALINLFAPYCNRLR